MKWFSFDTRQKRGILWLVAIIAVIVGIRMRTAYLADQKAREAGGLELGEGANSAGTDQGAGSGNQSGAGYTGHAGETILVDLNAADTAALKKVKGIGKTLARRIVRYRELIGGYRHVEELLDVYGMRPENFLRVEEQVVVDTMGEAYLALRGEWAGRSSSRDRIRYADRGRFRGKKGAYRARFKQDGAYETGWNSQRGKQGWKSGRRDGDGNDGSGWSGKGDWSARESRAGDSLAVLDSAGRAIMMSRGGIEGQDSLPPFAKNKRPPKHREPLDLNLADTLQMVTVPGVGLKTARRILKYRAMLGYFHSVEQLQEVWGISKENYQRMADFLFVEEDLTSYPHLHINQATVEMLAAHRYISWSNAKVIHAYREMHGPFSGLKACQAMQVVKPETWGKLAPYLVFD